MSRAVERPDAQLGARDRADSGRERSSTSRGWPARALVWYLGLSYLATAFGKSLDVRGFREVLRAYHLYPAWSLWVIAIGMTYVEAFVAWSFLTRRGLRPWGLLGSYLIAGGGAVILFIELARGIDLQNCGCYGVFLARPLQWYTPWEDVLMVAMTVVVHVKLRARQTRDQLHRLDLDAAVGIPAMRIERGRP